MATRLNCTLQSSYSPKKKKRGQPFAEKFTNDVNNHQYNLSLFDNFLNFQVGPPLKQQPHRSISRGHSHTFTYVKSIQTCTQMHTKCTGIFEIYQRYAPCQYAQWPGTRWGNNVYFLLNFIYQCHLGSNLLFNALLKALGSHIFRDSASPNLWFLPIGRILNTPSTEPRQRAYI